LGRCFACLIITPVHSQTDQMSQIQFSSKIYICRDKATNPYKISEPPMLRIAVHFTLCLVTFLSLLNRGSSPPTLLSAHSCCNSRAIIPPAPSSSSSSSASSPCCSAWTASNSATRLVDYRHGHSDRYPISSYYSSTEVGHSACDNLILNI